MADVGSSMKITRARQFNALATSTICCCPTRRLLTSALRIDRGIKLGEQCGAAAVLFLRVDQPGRRLQFASKKNVLGDRQVGDQIQFLIDDRDPSIQRLPWIRELDALAIQQNLPIIGLLGTGEDVHERRLAGPVLADQAVNLAGVDLEGRLDPGPARPENALQ